MQGTWNLIITRLNGKHVRCRQVSGDKPIKGETVECKTPDGSSTIKAIITTIYQTPPKGDTSLAWDIAADEIG
jgi:hypothetical protein